jgi:hypothetical protein
MRWLAIVSRRWRRRGGFAPRLSGAIAKRGPLGDAEKRITADTIDEISKSGRRHPVQVGGLDLEIGARRA